MQESEREGGGRQVRAGHCSHVDDVLDVEVLQGSQVRVHTPLILEDNLLKDPVQELPLLEIATVPLVCEDNRHHNFTEPWNPLGPCPRVTAWAQADEACPLPPFTSSQSDGGGNDATDADADDGDSQMQSFPNDLQLTFYECVNPLDTFIYSLKCFLAAFLPYRYPE